MQGDRISGAKCRRLLLADETGDLGVVLWNNSKGAEVSVCDTIEVKDASKTFDTYNGTNSLSINHLEQVVVSDIFNLNRMDHRFDYICILKTICKRCIVRAN